MSGPTTSPLAKYKLVSYEQRFSYAVVEHSKAFHSQEYSRFQTKVSSSRHERLLHSCLAGFPGRPVSGKNQHNHPLYV